MQFSNEDITGYKQRDSEEDCECHSHNKIMQPMDDINGQGCVYWNKNHKKKYSKAD